MEKLNNLLTKVRTYVIISKNLLNVELTVENQPVLFVSHPSMQKAGKRVSQFDLSEEDKEKIAHGNAERLLHIQ